MAGLFVTTHTGDPFIDRDGSEGNTKPFFYLKKYIFCVFSNFYKKIIITDSSVVICVEILFNICGINTYPT